MDGWCVLDPKSLSFLGTTPEMMSCWILVLRKRGILQPLPLEIRFFHGKSTRAGVRQLFFCSWKPLLPRSAKPRIRDPTVWKRVTIQGR